MTLAYGTFQRPAHPLHAILIGFPIALFTSAVAADIAYLATAEIQWSNFASWLIAGALVFGALVLLWALIDWVRKMDHPASRGRLIHLLLVGAMWVVGLFDALHHSRDAWSSVGPVGLALSIGAAVLALAAGGTLYSRRSAGEFR